MARPCLARLLPDDARTYGGPAFAWWMAVAYLAVLTVRSLIHLFAVDGGAATIATIDTTVAGGENIIALFGQWGAIQLLLAAVLWVLLLRYRGLTPFVYLIFIVEPALRAISGFLKPVEAVGTVPGDVLNLFAVPILVAGLLFSLCGRRPRTR
jgi:hypothetical protein